ncbi:hypothetical protein [Halonatronum saccharophilum]|uniref:hypothetical protein n=1 Tax=Halonatronum saccharophilum TaxID=150060 RepID=UPI00048A1DEC|nr:hypothetical protein [Halonatronum saccharophilum]
MISLGDCFDYKVKREEIILNSFDLKGMVVSFLAEIIVVGVTDKKGKLLGGVGGYLIPKSLLLLKDEWFSIIKIEEGELNRSFEEGLEGLFKEIVEGRGKFT